MATEPQWILQLICTIGLPQTHVQTWLKMYSGYKCTICLSNVQCLQFLCSDNLVHPFCGTFDGSYAQRHGLISDSPWGESHGGLHSRFTSAYTLGQHVKKCVKTFYMGPRDHIWDMESAWQLHRWLVYACQKALPCLVVEVRSVSTGSIRSGAHAYTQHHHIISTYSR